MKLNIHLPHNFHFGQSIPKTAALSNYELEIFKSTRKTLFKKVQTNLNKLKPNHWYDGVWDNLDYKI